MVSIYTLSDPTTGQVRYVGKTSVKPEARYAQHIYQWKRCKGKISYLNSWIKNLANKQLKPVLQVVDLVDDEAWVLAEQGYIRLFKSYGCKLVNLTIGGEGSSGYKHSVESISKRIASCQKSQLWQQKNKRHSEIMKELHFKGDVLFGTAHLPEDKRKYLGKRHSETLKKLHADNPDLKQAMIKARSIPVSLVDEQGKVLMTFQSASEAGRFFNINNTHITRVCKGKSTSTHGLMFAYRKKINNP